MPLHTVARTAQTPVKTKVRGHRVWTAIRRWFDRERELVRLRIACGMMAEARAADAREYEEMFQHCRELRAKVHELEHELDGWRAAGRAR